LKKERLRRQKLLKVLNKSRTFERDFNDDKYFGDFIWHFCPPFNNMKPRIILTSELMVSRLI